MERLVNNACIDVQYIAEDHINFCVCSCKFEAHLPEECPTNRDKKLRVANNVVLICPLELDITSSVL